jgi:hypothetical protein
MALTVAGVFLEINGHRLEANEPDAVSAVLALSTKKLDEEGFADWLRLNSRKGARPGRVVAVLNKSSKRKAKRKRK